MTRGDMVFR